MLHSFFSKLAYCGLALMLSACGQTKAPDNDNGLNELSPEELLLEPPAELLEADEFDIPPTVIALADLKGDFELAVFREDAYLDENGRWILDLVVGSFALIPVYAANEQGSSIVGMPLQYQHSQGLAVSAGRDSSGKTITDSQGQALLAFDVSGEPREETIVVTAQQQTLEIVINVLSAEVNSYSALNTLEGVLHWKELIKAEVTHVAGGVQASYPAELAAHHQTEVQLVGFMMPLDATEKQNHFILTSSPPSCFYHIPGGIAGGVEVMAKEPIAVSWEPILLKGILKIYRQNKVGVIYQLLDAEQVDLVLPDPN